MASKWMRLTAMKSEIRNPKSETSPKRETRKQNEPRAAAALPGLRVSDFGLRTSLLLVFLCVLLRARLLPANLFAVFQFAADDFVAAGDDLLPFAQTLGDFGVGVVVDAALDRRHLHVLAVHDEHDINLLRGLAALLAVLV